jgi:hypothetical protein
MVPPVIVADEKDDAPTDVMLPVTLPVYPSVEDNVVNAPEDGEEAPIVVLLICTPLMFTVVIVPVVITPVPDGLMISTCPAIPPPLNAGNLLNAWVIRLNSFRIATDAPGALGAGTVPPL